MRIVFAFLLTTNFLSVFPAYSQNNKSDSRSRAISYCVFYSAEYTRSVLNERYKPSMLSRQQLSAVLTIIKKVSDSLNFMVTETDTYTNKTDTLHYHFQIVPAKNQKGQIVVWINAFCGTHEEWRKRLIFVDDGGPCYYKFIVNLDQETYYKLDINAED